MRLLVSVTDADEASTAREGGADIVDAKDPSHGSLEPVPLATFVRMRAAIGDTTALSAAIGDATDAAAIGRLARDFAHAGAAFVKVGFTRGCTPARAEELLAEAVTGAGSSCRVVAVAYADDWASLAEAEWIGDAAVRAGATGVLLDTRDKSGPGLTALAHSSALHSWIRSLSLRGLEAALAGRLSIEDLSVVRNAGAQVAGVRGAACLGSRVGRVDGDLVRRLGHAARAGVLSSFEERP